MRPLMGIFWEQMDDKIHQKSVFVLHLSSIFITYGMFTIRFSFSENFVVRLIQWTGVRYNYTKAP